MSLEIHAVTGQQESRLAGLVGWIMTTIASEQGAIFGLQVATAGTFHVLTGDVNLSVRLSLLS